MIVHLVVNVQGRSVGCTGAYCGLYRGVVWAVQGRSVGKTKLTRNCRGLVVLPPKKDKKLLRTF